MDFKAPQSFEIHPVKRYLVNFMVLVGTVNATVNKTEPIFKQVSCMANCPNL